MKLDNIIQSLIFMVLLSFITLHIQGQQNVLSGKITSKVKGSPIANTNVTFTNTTIGTLSDNDGNYKIWTDQEVEKVQFSAVGYEKQIVSIDTIKSPILNIELNEIKLPSDDGILKKKRILSKSVRK